MYLINLLEVLNSYSRKIKSITSSAQEKLLKKEKLRLKELMASNKY